jgi:hypothetical protein
MEGGYGEDDFLNVMLEGSPRSLVFHLMGVEPVAVVVLGYLAEKSVDMIHGENAQMLLCGCKVMKKFLIYTHSPHFFTSG